MLDAYLIPRYSLMANTLFSFFFLFLLYTRLHRQGLSKYTSKEYLEKLNIRSFAICSLGISCIVSGVGSLCVALPKYTHGYYLNIFSQRVVPAHSLFYSQGNYILHHFGLYCGMMAGGFRVCFLFLTVCLVLPTCVYLLKDRTKICSILSYKKYCYLLAYALAKPAITAILLFGVGVGIGEAFSDYDAMLLLESVLQCVELIVLGLVVRGIAENLLELASSETFSTQQQQPSNSAAQQASYLPYADRLLLDSGVDTNPNALYSVVGSNAGMLSNALIAEGILNCIIIISYSFSGSTSNYSIDWIRDLLAVTLFFVAGFSTWFAVVLLMPLKRFHLCIKPADHPRLTHLESFFWRPSIFLMDPLSRIPIRQDHERRIAQAANLARIPRPAGTGPSVATANNSNNQ